MRHVGDRRGGFGRTRQRVLTFGCQRLRGQQRLRQLQPLELREEFRRRIAHGRVSGNSQLFFAVADLGCRTAAVTRERERIDQLAVRRVDEDLVADGHRAIDAAGFLRARERELLDARLEDGHAGRARAARHRRVSNIFASVNSARKISSIRCRCEAPSCAS